MEEWQQFKVQLLKGGAPEVYLEKDVNKAYPECVKKQMEAIDQIDCFKFVEDIDIDTESCSY